MPNVASSKIDRSIVACTHFGPAPRGGAGPKLSSVYVVVTAVVVTCVVAV
jgi:hypothetical protein